MSLHNASVYIQVILAYYFKYNLCKAEIKGHNRLVSNFTETALKNSKFLIILILNFDLPTCTIICEWNEQEICYTLKLKSMPNKFKHESHLKLICWANYFKIIKLTNVWKFMLKKWVHSNLPTCNLPNHNLLTCYLLPTICQFMKWQKKIFGILLFFEKFAKNVRTPLGQGSLSARYRWKTFGCPSLQYCLSLHVLKTTLASL